MKRPFVLLACFFLSSCLSTPPSAPPPTSSLPASGLPASGLPACGELPGEAWDTVDRIEAGGPFPYPDNDDRRFGNYERTLPEQPKNLSLIHI